MACGRSSIGKEIWIYYGEGKNDKYQYKNQKLYDVDGNYVNMSDVKNEFVDAAFTSLNGLINDGADQLGIINTLANDDTYTAIIIVEWCEKSSASGKINWASEGGIITNEGGRQSPAIGLIHELGHKYVEYYDPLEKKASGLSATLDEVNKYMDWYENAGAYDDQNEKIVITKIENPVARVYKQAERRAHYWTHKFRAVGGPFSTCGNGIKKEIE
ncbi:hypothetical protein EYV94_22895 [Puteibacter caeruleilacunae]|nr:hypothetical protein EYV94_22895 [Puteibacter caeruleilacunae]